MSASQFAKAKFTQEIMSQLLRVTNTCIVYIHCSNIFTVNTHVGKNLYAVRKIKNYSEAWKFAVYHTLFSLTISQSLELLYNNVKEERDFFLSSGSPHVQYQGIRKIYRC